MEIYHDFPRINKNTSNKKGTFKKKVFSCLKLKNIIHLLNSFMKY